MASDVETHIHRCDHCQRFKAKPQRAELSPIKVTHPLELVHIDFLTVESGKNNKDVNILVETDHFTKYSQSHVTSSQTVQVVVKTLWQKFFMHYGMPEKVLSDQGRNFESQLVSELCAPTNVKKLCTTLYHLQMNGQCKCFNVTLILTLGTLPPNAKQNWQEQIAALTHAYNCT